MQETSWTITSVRTQLNVAPGSVVRVGDEEWLVTAAEPSVDGTLVRVQVLTELVRDTTTAFYSGLDTIEVVDPAKSKIVADDTPNYRKARPARSASKCW